MVEYHDGREEILLEQVEFNIKTVIEEVILLFKPAANSKKNNITLHVASDVPLKLKGDIIKIKQIFNNLISNANKFTDEGIINIAIKKIKDINNNVIIGADVEDNGIGITKENIEKLFKPYVQADIATTRKYGGSGLGLSITKKIVEIMNGEIKVESKFGKGSKFSFCIELVKCADSYASLADEKKIIESKLLVTVHDIVLRIVNELKLPEQIADELVSDFIEAIPKLLEELRNSVYIKDYSEIERISHGIKGASSNLRMRELAEICLELEKNARLKDFQLCNNYIKEIYDMYLRVSMDAHRLELKGTEND